MRIDRVRPPDEYTPPLTGPPWADVDRVVTAALDLAPGERAAYVALAEALSAALVTRDARLGRSPGHRASIEVL